MFVGPSPRPITFPSIAFVPTSHHDTYPSISPSNFNLSGKSVFITGASKGIGRITALRFALAGASNIAISARSPLDEVVRDIKASAASADRPEPNVLALKLDVCSEDSVKAAVRDIEDAFGGRLDVLVANAGFSAPWLPLTDSDTSGWLKTFETSTKGLYLCAKYCLPLLLKSEMKTVLALSSIGSTVIVPGASAYQIAKMAVARFVEFVDQEYHTQGVVAVAVHPGGVATEMGLTMPESFHRLLTDTPELAGDAMVWLSGERREWLSGRYFSANWDVDEVQAKKNQIVERDLLKFGMRLE